MEAHRWARRETQGCQKLPCMKNDRGRSFAVQPVPGTTTAAPDQKRLGPCLHHRTAIPSWSESSCVTLSTSCDLVSGLADILRAEKRWDREPRPRQDRQRQCAALCLPTSTSQMNLCLKKSSEMPKTDAAVLGNPSAKGGCASIETAAEARAVSASAPTRNGLTREI